MTEAGWAWNWRGVIGREAGKRQHCLWGDSEAPHTLRTLKGISSRDGSAGVLQEANSFSPITHFAYTGTYCPGAAQRLWKGAGDSVSVLPTQGSDYEVILLSSNFSSLVS